MMTESGDTKVVLPSEERKTEDFVEIPIDAESDEESERNLQLSIDSLASPQEETTLLPPASNRTPSRTRLLGNSSQQTKVHRGVSQHRQDAGAGEFASSGDGPSGTTTTRMTTTRMTTTTADETTSLGDRSSSQTSINGVKSFFKKIWGGNTDGGDETGMDQRRRLRMSHSSCVHPSDGGSLNSVLEEDIEDTESNYSNRSTSADTIVCHTHCFAGPSSNHSLISSASLTIQELETNQSTMSIACRICQLNEEETDEDLERTSCHCKGSLQFAHKSCVRKWIQTQRSTSCEICKGQLADTEAAAEMGSEIPHEQQTNMMDRVANRLLINLGVTHNQLTNEEIEEIRRHIRRQLQRTVLNGAVCTLTVAIVVTCYVIVMTTHIEVGLPVLCALVILTIACKEKLAQLETNQ